MSRLFYRIQDVFRQYSDLFGDVPSGPGSPVAPPDDEILQAWFNQQTPSSLPVAGDSAVWWNTIILATVQPFLGAWAVEAIKVVDQEQWRQGYCPVCGGVPDLSLLDGANGARRLVCARCDAQWLFQRLQCPFCDNHEADSLAYFPDASGRYRLYVCDACHGYVKTVDLRSASAPAHVAVERLLTTDLDRQAAAHGYSPGARHIIPS
jgi:formate dehydrogenase maturation protein FdhE